MNNDWEFRIYVTGKTHNSLKVFRNLKRMCEADHPGQYRIMVVDLLKQPHRARTDQIVAIPTVVRRRPTPPRTFFGNLSQSENVFAGLEMPSAV
jgi:circadian clock protein KaiB